jgi:hypothetical protein
MFAHGVWCSAYLPERWRGARRCLGGPAWSVLRALCRDCLPSTAPRYNTSSHARHLPTPPPSSCCRANRLATAVRRELERRILAGELAPRREAERGSARRRNHARLAAARCARPSARSSRPGSCEPRRTVGVFVRSLTHFEATSSTSARGSRTPLIGRLAAERCTPRRWTELEALLQAT